MPRLSAVSAALSMGVASTGCCRRFMAGKEETVLFTVKSLVKLREALQFQQ